MPDYQILLQATGFEVAGIASNVDEARLLMRTIRHDVVTLDLSMPGTGGLDFLEELATRFHAPVVVVSGSTKNESPAGAQAIDRGAYACFDKALLLSGASSFLRLLTKAAASTAR